MCRGMQAHAPSSLSELSALECLGVGKFSKVWKVSHNEDASQVFILRITPKRALKGSNDLGALDWEQLPPHPFLLQRLQGYEDTSSIMVLQEFCAGGSLERFLQGCSRLPEAAARLLLAEVVLVVEHMHSVEIAVGELTPEILFLDAQGHIKLDAGSLLERGDDSWTPGYAAPELISGGLPCKASDWFSVGSLAHRVLLGQAPENVCTCTSPQAASRQGLSSWIVGISLRAQNFIHSLMKASPAARLGAGDADGADVRAHMLFAGVDFEALLQGREAPLAELEIVNV